MLPASRRIGPPMDVDRVLLAAPRGFCAGVEMAIKALAWMVRASSRPCTATTRSSTTSWSCRRFEDLGVVFVDDIDEVPQGRPIMLSAHGSAPEVVAAARRDAAATSSTRCARSSPRCTTRSRSAPVRLPDRLRRPSRATRRPSAPWPSRPTSIHRVESIDEVAELPQFDEPVALLAQTTLCHRDWSDVLDATRARFPDMWVPGRSDLCFATTNRQSGADGHRRAAATPSWWSARRTRRTRCALEKLAREAGCDAGVPRQRRRRAARRPARHDRRHRRRLGPRGARRRRDRTPRATRRRRGGPDRPTRTSTSRPLAT